MKPAQGLTKGQGGRLDGTESNAVVEGKTRVRVYPPGRHCPKPMTVFCSVVPGLNSHCKVFLGFLLPVLPEVTNGPIPGVKRSLRVVAQARGPFHREALLLRPVLATSLTSPSQGRAFSSVHGDA